MFKKHLLRLLTVLFYGESYVALEVEDFFRGLVSTPLNFYTTRESSRDATRVEAIATILAICYYTKRPETTVDRHLSDRRSHERTSQTTVGVGGLLRQIQWLRLKFIGLTCATCRE